MPTESKRRFPGLLPEDEAIENAADRIEAALAHWLEIPLHRMAYTDAARAALVSHNKIER